MNKQIAISNNCIIFSRWSGKGFAVFASLHKVVNIARISIDICISSLTKNKALIRFLKEQKQLLLAELKADSERLLNSDWITVILLELGLIKLDESCNSSFTYFMNQESPYTA